MTNIIFVFFGSRAWGVPKCQFSVFCDGLIVIAIMSVHFGYFSLIHNRRCNIKSKLRQHKTILSPQGFKKLVLFVS